MAFANRFETFVSIPLKASGGGGNDKERELEYIDILQSELPSPDDAVALLRAENATAELWHRVALLYYRNGESKSFFQIADEGYRVKQPQHNSDCKESSVVPLLLSLAAYFYSMASLSEDDLGKRERFLNKTANCYNKILSLGFNGFESEYYVGRAYSYLLTDELEHADKHFTFILTTLNPSYIPAIVGKAHLAFGKKDYTTALQYFRQALQLDPNGAANVRVGIGHCFWKLNNLEKAKIAYERAVEVFPNDHNAVCALATFHLNTMKPEEIITGVKLLARAHSICPSHPATQLYLADHYYYKKEFEKSLNLALEVCKNTSVDDIRKRSAYLAGRCYQAKGDFKYAMHYYYQALSEPDTGFHLPYFGLAQCYLHFNDGQHCSDILVKMLGHEPKNLFAMKMLGSLECTSEDPAKRERAQKHLKAVLDHDPDDVNVRLALATSLEAFDDNKAREHYFRALAIMKSRNLEIQPEIYNNLGCSLFRLKEYETALDHFEMALDLVQAYLEDGTNSKPLMTTLNFNRARTREAMHEYGIAETIYKEILKKHPSYYSCFIRLAVIYRDRNNLHEAEAYFKEALQCSLENPDVWAYIGNLHLAQGETLPAQKKFLRILEMNESLKADAYSLIALGNVKMSKAFNCIYDTNTTVEAQLKPMHNYMNQSLGYYQQVLEREPNNLWAANGVGCIFSAKGLFTEAREIFSQVRENVQGFKDVWLNIAHTYLEQDLYTNAIQMYEGCNFKFSVNTDTKLLQCLAKAYYHNKSYNEAKLVLLKCLRVAPYDKTILFSLAKTLRKIGWQTFHFSTGSPNLPSTLEGLEQIKLAKKIFERMSKKQSNSSSLIKAAEFEARHCDDLIRQTPHMLSRIEAEYQREQSLKNKREREVQAFKEKQRQEKELRDKRKREEDQDALKRREAVKRKIEKVKQTLELESINEARKKERRVKKEKEKEELMDNSFIDDDDEYRKTATPPVVKKKTKKKDAPEKKPTTSCDIAATPANEVVASPSQSKRKGSTGSKATGKKTYSRIRTDVVFDLSDASDHEDKEKIVKPKKVTELSPDITRLPLYPKKPATTVKVEGVQKNDPVDQLENPSQEPDVSAAVKNEEENILHYLEIASNSGSQSPKTQNDGGSGTAVDLQADDLPPVLTSINDMSWSYNPDADSPPPVLHSIYSDNEDD